MSTKKPAMGAGPDTGCLRPWFNSWRTGTEAVSVRVSPISRTAAILIIALGVFTLVGGLVADVQANEVAGGAFIVLGLALYWLLLRFTRRLESEIKDVQKD